MFPLEIETLARLLIDEARGRSLRLVTAESCTGGLVAGAICAIPGASDVFERGFVTYTNRAKSEMLGVPGDLIADHGAVSEPVARMMAEGALRESNGHVAVVGTVHFAVARANRSVAHRHERFLGDTREAVQLAAIITALEMLREAVA
jgi:nicotinamide-nucleotide amidase